MENPIHHNNLLPGIISNEVEFFALSAQDVRCLNNGVVVSFEDFPEWIIEKVKKAMGNIPSQEEIKNYIFTHFGGVDTVPDIDENGNLNYSEYCEAKKNLPISEGKYLTPRQIEILKNISLSNQEIADRLFISIESVKSHIQNIMEKTGLHGRVELAIFATKKGII